jgi:multidrug transporter EmrE-like cation transporter
MTQLMLFTLGLAIAGQVVYQIGQRAVPHDAPPLMVLAAAYFAAGVLCLVLGWPFGLYSGGLKLKSAFDWPTWLIAAAIVAIEMGYLTAFRSGWTIGTAFATASSVTIIALAVIGWIAYHHSLSVRQVAGLAFACIGVWLLCSGARPP